MPYRASIMIGHILADRQMTEDLGLHFYFNNVEVYTLIIYILDY